ncbi:chemotaxis response regulator protein-glutamate methylesterase [Desulfotomaculum defluvii]
MGIAVKTIKVLVVDDSALVREILAQGLAMDPEIEVVGVASNPYVARDKIVRLRPDVLTLDVEMPKMDGVEFLKRLMPQYPLPVVMVSALAKKGAKITLEALAAGAVDFVTKPSTDIARGLNAMLGELRQKIKIAATANVQAWKEKRPSALPGRFLKVALAESTDKVIAIGASTGGTEAIRRIIRAFPASTPGIVIVQHMPPGFTKHFAQGLNEICEMEVLEARTNDRVMPGRVLIAPGGKHMTVRRSGGMYLVTCEEGANVNGHCPSVDVLFNSVARHVGSNAVGVILTGMGHDGAAGMLAMRQAGAKTLAQDEHSSVVFGMPKVAFEKGGAEALFPLSAIPNAIALALHGRCR